MDKSSLIIGGERSSGKTTLLNYLVGGTVNSPFPRGVRGRLSQINSATFSHPEPSIHQENTQAAVRVSTDGPDRKEISLSVLSGNCSELLLLTAHDLSQHILRSQPIDEPTCLSMSVESSNAKAIGLITEIGPGCLRDYVESGILTDPIASTQIQAPDVYIHLTSAIKPLAYVERQAILRFIADEVPVILFVNKCDLVEDDESLEEIDGLVSMFSSVDCGRWLPNYLCSFDRSKALSDAVLGIEKVAELIHSTKPVRSALSKSHTHAPMPQSPVQHNFSCSKQPVHPEEALLSSHSQEISVWPPEEHRHLIDKLNQHEHDPVAFFEELKTIDSAMLSKLQIVYWQLMRPGIRHLLWANRRQAQ
jgi:GTPase SAR1 family protein